MRRSLILITMAAMAFGLGCDGTSAEPDSGTQIPDTDAGPTCGDPGSNYGTSVGKNFLPFTLPRCDDTPFEFYGEEEGFCDSTYTVVTMAAGWCQPCRIEARDTQRLLVEAYADRGVRIVVAIIQDNDYGAPDAEFCQGWVDEYGLTNPVVYDVEQETGIYFPAGALPANLIVDSQGKIVHREYGVSESLATIRAKLDQLLAQ